MRGRARSERGATLLETMCAMAVLMVGATGFVGLHNQSSFFMGDARRAARAAAFGQDLVQQMELWAWDDPRLANASTANDDDLGDSAGQFDTVADPVAARLADHGEAHLGTAFTGLPRDALEANRMERFWNVDAGADGVRRIAVIVRWPVSRGWRKAVFMATKLDPGSVR